jgi:hypothetical protein
MRKIESQMVEAISERRNWKNGNTEVRKSIKGMVVRLFGNEIAYVRGGNIHLNMPTIREYPTATTKSRLKAMGVDIYSRNNETYIDLFSVDDLTNVITPFNP